MATEIHKTPSQIPRRKRQRKRSFTEALKEKYCAVDEEPAGGFVVEIVVIGKPKHNETDAELGFLRNVVLSKYNVSHAGIPAGGLKTLCPNVVDLDLSSNLLDNWLDALNIMAGLPHLKFVNLSSNILHDPGDILEKWDRPVKSIENLVLNHTGIQLSDVASLAKHMQGLRELHLCGNGYKTIQGDVSALRKLECLRMNNNSIKSWKEVWKLKQLDQLKTLVLSGNPLEDVFYHPVEGANITPPGGQSPNYASASKPIDIGRDSITSECMAFIDSLITDVVKIVEDDTGADSKSSAGRKITEIADDSNISALGIESLSPRSTYLKRFLASNEKLEDECQDEENENGSEEIENDNGTENIENGNAMEEEEEIANQTRAEENGCGEDDKTNENYDEAGASRHIVAAFPKLKFLCMSETEIHSWDHLHALSQFPNLESLRIKGIRLMRETTMEERRKVFVALLPNIKHLNGSEVTSPEREKSERHLIRFFNDKAEKPERFHDLEKKHGPLKPLVDLDLGFGYTEWVRLSFVYKNKIVHRAKLHAIEPVGKLRSYIAKKLKIPRWTFRMYHMPSNTRKRDPGDPQFEELFSDNLPMSRFDFQDGDQIHIDDSGLAPNDKKPVPTTTISER